MIIDFHTHIFSKAVRENRRAKSRPGDMDDKAVLYAGLGIRAYLVVELHTPRGELAFYQSGIDRESRDRLRPVMDICLEKNLPVLIHTNEPVGHVYPGKTPNTLAQIYKLVQAFPENKIVLAHWGGGIFLFNLLRKEVRETLKNVWFDTAASPFLYRPEIYGIAKQLAGLDKILLGTDFPLLKPARYFKELEAASISAEDREMICGGNAASLLRR